MLFCVIVLIGEKTAGRRWINYEIEKAWKDKKGLFGIYIHNIADLDNKKAKKGKNPFDYVGDDDGNALSNFVTCYEPDPNQAYKDIKNHIDAWIEKAIKEAEER